MSIDFLIGAIRASRDLHPNVSTELEEILHRSEPMEPEIRHGTTWCAVCGNHLKKIGKNVKDNYCGKCGQVVKWE